MATGLAALGEVYTGGSDTPVTEALGDATAFLTGAAYYTHAGAGALNAYATGNSNALLQVNFSGLFDYFSKGAANAAVRQIPELEHWADALADALGDALDLATEVKGGCQQ